MMSRWRRLVSKKCTPILRTRPRLACADGGSRASSSTRCLGEIRGSTKRLLRGCRGRGESSSSSSSESSDLEEERLRGRRAHGGNGADIQGRTYYYDSVTGSPNGTRPTIRRSSCTSASRRNFVIRSRRVSSSEDEDGQSESEDDEDPRLHPEYEEHDDGENKYYFHVPSGCRPGRGPVIPLRKN